MNVALRRDPQKVGIMSHAFDTSTQEAEAETDRSGLHIETHSEREREGGFHPGYSDCGIH